MSRPLAAIRAELKKAERAVVVARELLGDAEEAGEDAYDAEVSYSDAVARRDHLRRELEGEA